MKCFELIINGDKRLRLFYALIMRYIYVDPFAHNTKDLSSIINITEDVHDQGKDNAKFLYYFYSRTFSAV